MNNQVLIRFAQKKDAPKILDFIQALAKYEKLSHEVTADTQQLEETLFGQHSYAEVLIAESENTSVGFALFFHNYSTFLGQPGLYLEDLFVKPEARGLGVGKAFLQKLAKIALERKCGRLEWSVLDWNEPAIGFYTSIGAKAMDEWTVYRMTETAMQKFIAQ